MKDTDKSYLTFSSIEKTSKLHETTILVKINLSDTKQIRSRVVYSLLELVSEISGFADVLFICAGVFFTHFYVPALKKAHLVVKLITIDS